MKGQEDIAYSRLKKVSEELSRGAHRVLDAITEPMTYENLKEKVGWSKRYLSRLVRDLEVEGKLMRVRIPKNYITSELFGNLVNQLYLYKPGQEEDMASLIIQKLPPREKMDRYTKQVLTNRLKRYVPKSVFKIVYLYYTPVYDILTTIASQSRGMSLKEISRLVVYYGVARRYLQILEKEGMVSRTNGIFKPTPLGLEFVEKYKGS